MMKKIYIELLKKKNEFLAVHPLSKQEIKIALDEAVSKIEEILPRFVDLYPSPSSVNQQYIPIDNIEWTNGFWTGILWLAYEYSQKDIFKEVAEKQVSSYLKRIDHNIEVDHHDMGFLYIPSCVAAYKITGNPQAKIAALRAADKLISRYHEKGEFIQAWGEMGRTNNYRLIIDCMLNIPLLYWASQETGNTQYKDRATKHFYTSCNTVIRDDASTYHTYYFDPETGNPLKGITRQGYNDHSSWARGQAWGVYGIPLNYLYTKNDDCIDYYKGVTNYFLNRCPEDTIAYWDLIFTDKDNQARDSSAATIAICGILEMDKILSSDDVMKKPYLGATHRMMRTLIAEYSSPRNNPKADGLLLHGVYSWHDNKGVDECTIWGDYFYMEALLRLYTDNKWESYW
ncbi:MAG: glycoside hydrolase family 88 protein [Brevinema sp.]